MPDVEARTARPEDVADIVALSEHVFADATMTAWRPQHVRSHIQRFRAGQIVVLWNDELVASSTSMRTGWGQVQRPHTWMGITGGNELANHDPEGPVLYGLEIMVHPEHRRRGLARLIYQARKVLVRQLALEGLVVVGRIPGFDEARLVAEIDVEDYVAEVVQGKRQDPVLSMQLSVGLEPDGLLENYVWDPASRHHGVRLTWRPEPD